MKNSGETIANAIAREGSGILEEWMREQVAANGGSAGRIREPELRKQCRDFLDRLGESLRKGDLDHKRPEWKPVLEFLADLSRSRAMQGFSASETATFIFSLKRPLFTRFGREFAGDADGLYAVFNAAGELLDGLGLYTTEVFQKGREEVIHRQQQEMLELSTPVVSLWEGILALPMIGTLDSGRTQVVMETLLQRIVDTGSKIAIIDITGVPTVDTLVAQHLMKTVAAARLMGADCIISGIRPQIAQTIVHLAIDLTSITTKATLADAFLVALQRIGSAGPRSPVAGRDLLQPSRAGARAGAVAGEGRREGSEWTASRY